jgi:ABC-type lipoprotein export system ATPase subunit
MPSVVRLSSVEKTYRMGDIEVRALRSVSMAFERGEMVAIMGASGSGKSTTLNVIGTLDRPTAGRYFLDREDHLPNQLSGGQQQRVAIARAIVNDPLLLLADEPTGALDSATTRHVMELFTSLHEQGITVILVTHDAAIADYAERVVTFADGNIVSDRRRAA